MEDMQNVTIEIVSEKLRKNIRSTIVATRPEITH